MVRFMDLYFDGHKGLICSIEMIEVHPITFSVSTLPRYVSMLEARGRSNLGAKCHSHGIKNASYPSAGPNASHRDF